MTWVLIMVLLVSQSSSFVSPPCESIPSESISDATAVHHHDMDMDMDDMLTTSHPLSEYETHHKKFAMECCDAVCVCPTGSFSSDILSHFMTTNSAMLVPEPLVFAVFLKQQTFLQTLLKPPLVD